MTGFSLMDYTPWAQEIYRPYVNQAGYNPGESKLFVCYSVSD